MMQATNKSDATQIYENTIRSSKIVAKDLFKFVIKPLSIFSYRFLLEGIRAVQKDGPTKEIQKITNLNYAETIGIMEKCQRDGIRVAASERKLNSDDNNFGKKKTMFQQLQITKISRRIKGLSNFKVRFPKISKAFFIDNLIRSYKAIENLQIRNHENKRYNIYFNKSKVAYMANKIEDIIELRTGVTSEKFDKETKQALMDMKNDTLDLNSEKLNVLSQKFKINELGSVEVESFDKNYCVHEMPYNSFNIIKNELETSEIEYGLKIVNSSTGKLAQVYFPTKSMSTYSELGFNENGKIYVYGSDRNMEWSIGSRDELVSFRTKSGEEEEKTYEILDGKNYVMKKEGEYCHWTILKKDLTAINEEEKKRDIVKEDIISLEDSINRDNEVVILEESFKGIDLEDLEKVEEK